MENIIDILESLNSVLNLMKETTGLALLISLGIMGVTAVIGATAMGCKLVYQFFTMD